MHASMPTYARLKGNGCDWYWLNIMIDTTIGVGSQQLQHVPLGPNKMDDRIPSQNLALFSDWVPFAKLPGSQHWRSSLRWSGHTVNPTRVRWSQTKPAVVIVLRIICGILARKPTVFRICTVASVCLRSDTCSHFLDLHLTDFVSGLVSHVHCFEPCCTWHAVSSFMFQVPLPWMPC